MNQMEEMMTPRFTMPLCDRTVNTEITGEYTLPDYQPEIRRLLNVGLTVLPPAKYVGAGGVELNGTVEYRVLYVGGDGGLYTAPLSAEYSVTVPTEQVGGYDPGEGVTAFATTVCEALTPRVSAPRKLSLRCRLRSRVRAYGCVAAEEEWRGTAEPASIRRLCEEARGMRAAGGLSDVLSLTEEITGVGEDARVISAEARVFVHDSRPAEGSVRASGEVLLELLVGRESGAVEAISRKLPLEGEIEVDGMTSNSICRVSGTVCDTAVTVEEGRILCELGVLLEARGFCDQPFSYTADLFSTEVESECDYEDYELPVILRCENRNLSQSERLPLSSVNLPEGATVLSAFGEARLDACEQMGERYVLTGQSRYLLLCEKEGEFSAAEVTLPLRYDTEGSAERLVGFDAVAEVISCRARIDGENLNLDGELSLVTEFLGSESVRTVRAVRFGEKLTRHVSRMVICYPNPGDTPWTVAKRYHLSPDSLTEGASYYLL